MGRSSISKRRESGDGLKQTASTLAAAIALGFLGFACTAKDIVACSVERLLTVHELFVGARVIVRATPVSYRETPALASGSGSIEFRVLEVLKGGDFPEALSIAGTLEEKDDFNDRPVPYDFVRPGGRLGMCHAANYKKGAEYLLFLMRYRQKLLPYGALAPANEQLRSAHDPWLIWVRNYLAAMARSQDPRSPLRKLGWVTEVRPALESSISVSNLRRNGTGGKPFSAAIERPRASMDPFIADPLLQEVAALLVSRGGFVRSEVADGYLKTQQERGKAAVLGLGEIERSYRSLFLADPQVIRHMMPVIHRLLAARRAECPDCPGPAGFSSVRITKKEIFASIASQAWRVYEIGPAPRSMERDLLIKEAAHQILTENEAASERVFEILDRARRSVVYREDQGQQARGEALRSRLAESLAQDNAFLDAIRPSIQKMREMGIVCIDCDSESLSGELSRPGQRVPP